MYELTVILQNGYVIEYLCQSRLEGQNAMTGMKNIRTYDFKKL